jgi:hypothetical protein
MSTKPRRLLHSLWRMQGTIRIVTAEMIYSHVPGWQLVVGFEGREDDVLQTQVERVDVAVLERKAAEMRNASIAKGWSWIDAPPTTDTVQ